MSADTDATDTKDTQITPDSERRVHRRVRGPFDGVRMGLLEFDVSIYDLSAGGCLVDSRTEIRSEHPIRLRIELPTGNSVTVRGLVTVPPRDVGYAVRFVDLDEPARHAIEQALEYVQLERSQN
jgi:hypothetical protein